MFKTLLLTVDINDPEGGARAAHAAATMAKAENAKLHILNVIPDAGMAIVGASLNQQISKDVTAKVRTALADWAKAAIPEAIDTELHITHGTVYDQIIKMANSLNADGIFVGAHRPELKDYLIGPNAARVARHATQSVFVIR
ncbi:universal stress protein [Primorskyibacter sp. S187A]|uniref:universal stress protein n=1 Tax=Primorskyibacter sp. S187A TaxID=3415130 RepID=UPI003C7CA2B0